MPLWLLPETPVCPECDQASVRPLDVKEALLRLAGQFELPVEVVEKADALMALGGVGCLLRSRREARKGPADLRAPPLSARRSTERTLHSDARLSLPKR